jgi:hypothetical protein
MNPEPGNYVKVLFNNGTAAEGFVRSWSDHKSVLETEAQDSFFVIQNTENSVLAIKIFPGYRHTSIAQKEFEDVRALPRDQNNIKKLAELRTELNRQEREAFFNQATSHELGQIQPVQYHVFNVPQATEERGSQQHSAPQAPRTNLRTRQGVPNVQWSQTPHNRQPR